MDNIVFLSSNYPSKSRPNVGTFVHQLVKAIASLGQKCNVINPVSIFDRKYGRLDPEISVDSLNGNAELKVVRPRYVSFSSIKLPFFNTDYLTHRSFLSAAYKAISTLDCIPGVMYGHFLYPGGAASVHIAQKLGIPSITAVGESSLWSVEPVGYQKAVCDFGNVNGVVSVSSVIKKSLIDKLKIPESKIRVFPNGVDLSLFYPRNRAEMRAKYGLPVHKFIIAFVGHFDERKGPHRLLTAVSNLENIGLIFLGSGSITLESRNILFKGILEHSKVPEMLSAADIFVLPTLSEGSCNAVLEALACGLPVVTSKGDFNDDIVDDNVAIRVDPLDINEIHKAIITLYDNSDRCRTMSTAALEWVKKYDIIARANNILEWIRGIKENFECPRHDKFK